jgi:hypothetical protein
MGNSMTADLRPGGVNAMQAAAPQPWPSNSRFKARIKEKHAFDVHSFLNSAGPWRKVIEFRRRETIFSQGDPSNVHQHHLQIQSVANGPLRDF